MTTIVPIVEGDGDVQAVPELMRRWLYEVQNRYDIQILKPKNAHGCQNLIKPNGIEYFVENAQSEVDAAGIIVLIDSDDKKFDNCPVRIASHLSARLRADDFNLKVPVVIVCATMEYEAWFLASLATIAGVEVKGSILIDSDVEYEGDVETRRDVKRWLTSHFPHGIAYRETLHQVAFTQKIDFDLARQNSRSFERFEDAMQELIDAIDSNQIIVTPIIADET